MRTWSVTGSCGGGRTWRFLSLSQSLSKGERWLDTTAIPGILYAYSLRSVDTSGNLSSVTREVSILLSLDCSGDPSQPPLVTRVYRLLALPLDPSIDAVRLRWQVEGREDLAGFRVYRETVQPGVGGAAARRSGPGSSAPTGNKSAPPTGLTCLTANLVRGTGAFSFDDHPLVTPGLYRYWVEAVATETDQPGQWLDPLFVTIPDWGARWLAVAPNPTAGPVSLAYSRTEPGSAHLTFFDLAGRLIGRLEREESAGSQVWELPDLREICGREMMPSVCFFRLQAGGLDHHDRLVVLRRP